MNNQKRDKGMDRRPEFNLDHPDAQDSYRQQFDTTNVIKRQVDRAFYFGSVGSPLFGSAVVLLCVMLPHDDIFKDNMKKHREDLEIERKKALSSSYHAKNTASWEVRHQEQSREGVLQRFESLLHKKRLQEFIRLMQRNDLWLETEGSMVVEEDEHNNI